MSETKREYKEKHELIKTEEFFVSYVTSESEEVMNSIDIANRNEWGSIIGSDGKPFDDIYGDYDFSREIKGGLLTKYILEVNPKNKIPIKRLEFYGILPILGGTNIKAKIFKGKLDTEKISKKTFGRLTEPGDDLTSDYFERDYNEKESALEIIIYKDNKAIQSLRSTQYKNFFKDSLF